MIKNSRYMIIFLALLIAGMSVAVAADIDDTASVSSDVSDAVEVDTTSTVDTQAVASVSEDNNQKIIKETKSVKSDENDPVVVTTSTQFDKIVKKDSDITYSDDELVIYSNGTAILTVTGKNQQYISNGQINSHLNDVNDLSDIIIYVNEINLTNNWNRFKANHTINLGVNKENIDLKFVWNASGNTAIHGFIFDNLGYKSLTYENCKFYIKPKESEMIKDLLYHWGFRDNVKFINCSFEYILVEALGGNSLWVYNSDLYYQAPEGYYVDPGITENIMSIVGENISFTHCTFNLKTALPLVNIAFPDDTHYTLIIAFNNSKNVVFDGNTFSISTSEADSSIDPTSYGPFLSRNVNNLTFINNEVTIRYARGIILKTNNSLFENNTITVMNMDNTIELTGDNNIVHYNTLTSQSGEGDSTVITNGENNIVEQNPYVEVIEPLLKVDTTEFTVGTSTNIQASIYIGDEVATDINKGKVSFKVNGKTLKDLNGKVIYAKVVNGVAVIENYEVSQDWAKEGTTIQAVYSGCANLAKMSSDKENLTVTVQEPSITTSDIQATVGQSVTLTATVTAATPVNNGKVVFKINGKTVKDANGKVIYTKVTDGTVNVEYALPSDMKAQEYTLTAVLISNDYGRLEDVKTLTITS